MRIPPITWRSSPAGDPEAGAALAGAPGRDAAVYAGKRTSTAAALQQIAHHDLWSRRARGDVPDGRDRRLRLLRGPEAPRRTGPRVRRQGSGDPLLRGSAASPRPPRSTRARELRCACGRLGLRPARSRWCTAWGPGDDRAGRSAQAGVRPASVPEPALRDAAAAAREPDIARPAVADSQLHEFCGWYRRGRPRAAALYVEAFDFTKQCSLHLTYHVHGDRRQRGLAMLGSRRLPRRGFDRPATSSGLSAADARVRSTRPDDAAAELLDEHRVSIELVRAGLRRDHSPFAPVLRRLVGGLGRLSRRSCAHPRFAAEVRRPSRSGSSRSRRPR